MDVRRPCNARRMRSPALIERLRAPAPVRFERPRHGFDADVLEELIGAVNDRLDVEADPCRRVRLERGRVELEAELGRMLAA